jgi:hypothetical protein
MRRNEVGLAGSVTALRREGQLLDKKQLACFMYTGWKRRAPVCFWNCNVVCEWDDPPRWVHRIEGRQQESLGGEVKRVKRVTEDWSICQWHSAINLNKVTSNKNVCLYMLCGTPRHPGACPQKMCQKFHITLLRSLWNIPAKKLKKKPVKRVLRCNVRASAVSCEFRWGWHSTGWNVLGGVFCSMVPRLRHVTVQPNDNDSLWKFKEIVLLQF